MAHHGTHDDLLALHRLLGLRQRGDGELAVGVPPVHALHARDDLADPARLTGVEATRQGGHRVRRNRRSAATRDEDSPDWAKPRGIKTFVYSNSLLIVMSIIFFGSWFAQSVTGWTEFNAEQVDHHEATVTWLGYVGSARLLGGDPRELAVGVPGGRLLRRLTVFLRQRGSPESKPVGAPTTPPASRASSSSVRSRRAWSGASGSAARPRPAARVAPPGERAGCSADPVRAVRRADQGADALALGVRRVRAALVEPARSGERDPVARRRART